MTRQEAINEQNRLAIFFGEENLGWWFGTRCERCCDVLPRFVSKNTNDKYHSCAYRCDVCGKQTEWTGMPWQAEEAWNNHEYQGVGVQLSFV